MKIEEYRKQLQEDIAIEASSEMINPSSAFLKKVTDVLIDAEEFDDFTECYYEGVTRRNANMRIDGYAIDESDGTCCVFYSEYYGAHGKDSVVGDDIKNAFRKIRYFVEESINTRFYKDMEESTEEYEFSEYLFEHHDEIRKFRFFMLTDAYNNQRTKNLKSESLNDIPVELNVWDIERLFEIVNSTAQKESIEINVSAYETEGIPCVKGTECSDVISDVMTEFIDETDGTTQQRPLKVTYTSYLAVVPGKLLCDLYIEYGSRLLEGNVRSFLSARGKVNTSIRNTIVKCPEMFFAYNNGIAATASEIETELTENGLIITKIKDLQIVNGGQTTASIANTLLHPKRGEVIDISRLKIPMKISVLDSSMAEKLIPKISQYSNSQNKVDASDFFSNHPFHIRMEDFSRKTPAPAVNGNQYQQYWFYERTRGQYNHGKMKLSDAQVKQYKLKYPENQVIKMVNLAKYMEIYEGHPDKVSKGKQAIVREFSLLISNQWKKNDAVFNLNYYKRLVAIAIIFQNADRIIKNSDEYRIGGRNSYKANVIAYMLSLIFWYIRVNRPNESVDFIRIWNEQKLYPEFENQIRILWPQVYDYITDNSRPTQNVTEWCKRELCWENAKKQAWDISDEFLDTLILKDDSKREEKESEKDQKLQNEIKDLEFVWKLGTEYWQKLLIWGNENKLLYRTEQDAIQLVIKMYSTGHTPNSRQLKIVLMARERLIKEGMTE